MAKTIPEVPEGLVVNDNTQYVMDSGTQTFKVKGSTLRAYFSAAIQNTIDTVILPGLALYRKSVRSMVTGNWTTQATPPVTSYITGVAYSSKQKIFWAVSKHSANTKLLYSVDGRNWTVSTYNTINKPWEDLCYSKELDMFVAVTSDTTNLTQIITSTAGGAWTGRTSAIAKSILSVCWSPELNLFVAVGNIGLVQTSPNGINWTVRTAADGLAIYGKVVWASGLGLFFAFPRSGTTTYATSPDGVTWTQRTIPDAINGDAVVWAEEIGLLISVGGGRTSISSDGLTWTHSPLIYNPFEQIGSPSQAGFNAVCWSKELKMFLAVGVNNNEFCAYSLDGLNWTFQRMQESGSLIWRIFWFSDFGFFIGTSEETGIKFVTSLSHTSEI